MVMYFENCIRTERIFDNVMNVMDFRKNTKISEPFSIAPVYKDKQREGYLGKTFMVAFQNTNLGNFRKIQQQPKIAFYKL